MGGINQSRLVNLQEASELIKQGCCLTIAGDHKLLQQLPPGHWIAGSIPYFMSEKGGIATQEKLFIHDFSIWRKGCQIKTYTEKNLEQVCVDAPENGFSLIILPGGSDILSAYARYAPDYEDMFIKPIVGWVSGQHLKDSKSPAPIVMNGLHKKPWDNQAVVMHFNLPSHQVAVLDIVNLFEQGDGHEIRFPASGFCAEECLIDGEHQRFSDFLRHNKIDTRLPLVADYNGAMVNVSIKEVNDTDGKVDFYAPVFSDVTYKMALPVTDYASAFQADSFPSTDSWAFSCNCILNYLFMGLEGKKTLGITGPFTFGEIAYQLLNQTLVYLSIEEC